MERKKLIFKMALGALLLALIAGCLMIFEFFRDNSLDKWRVRKRKEHIAALTADCQKFLDETAGKIDSLTVNKEIIGRVKSEIFKKQPETKLYLWMSDKEGRFIFGEPAPIFTRLNKAFDKYGEAIKKDGYYMDRNDYLVKLVHQHNNIEFTQFEPAGEQGRRRGTEWRFYRENRHGWNYADPVRLALSAPVIGEDGTLVGELYLKLDDSTPRQWYYANRRNFLSEFLFPLSHGLLGFSLVFLWLLIPSWVYIDARQRDVKKAGMWAVLTVISLGFAWLVYLITRPAEMASFHCPQCEHELNGTRAFCPHCGLDLSSTFCSQCQYPIKGNWRFCPNCRNDLTRVNAVKEEGAS